MPIVGSFAGASSRAYGLQAGLIGDFESIASTTVGASGAANVTFSSIPQTYKHLQIRILARSNRVGSADDLLVNFNGDTSIGYASHSILGDGSASAVTANANATAIRSIRNALTTSSNTSNVFTSAIIDIYDYAISGKYKTIKTLFGFDANGSGYVGLSTGYWNGTSAITEIVLKEETGSNLIQYSSMALYGIKG